MLNKRKQEKSEESASSSTSSSGEGEYDEENKKVEGIANEEEEEEEGNIDYKRRVMKGSFLPALVMLEMKQINVEEAIDPNQGLKMMHYACYFGKIKAMKALYEEY